MKRRSGLWKVVLGAAVVSVLTVAFLGLGNSGPPKARSATSRVSRGTVLASVTATGNVTADTELGLDFDTGGRITELAVKVGDRVARGQLLARVDAKSQSANLTGAFADLATARAELARTTQGASPEQRAADGASVARARQQGDAAVAKAAQARATADQNAKGYDTDVSQARTAVSQARATATRNKTNYDSDVTQAQKAAEAARRDARDSRNTNPLVDSVTGARRSADSQLRSAEAQLVQARNARSSGLLADQQAIKDAQDQLTAVTNQAASGRLADRQSIADADQAVDAARADLNSAVAEANVSQAPARPAEIASARAGVAKAQAGVDAARADLDETSLTAPVGGTVASVSAETGELVSAGGLGAIDPGGSSTGSLTGSGSASAADSGQNKGFIVLADLDTLQVEVGFSEVDAAKIRPRQAGVVTFEGLPGTRSAARVGAVDPVSTLVRNVVTYNVTVVLDQVVEGIKPGMTSSVQVNVAERDRVLRLPLSAVGGRGERPVVTVAGTGGKSVVKPVVVGLRGDESVEIVSGLSEGDRVLTRAADPR